MRVCKVERRLGSVRLVNGDRLLRGVQRQHPGSAFGSEFSDMTERMRLQPYVTFGSCQCGRLGVRCSGSRGLAALSLFLWPTDDRFRSSHRRVPAPGPLSLGSFRIITPTAPTMSAPVM